MTVTRHETSAVAQQQQHLSTNTLANRNKRVVESQSLREKKQEGEATSIVRLRVQVDDDAQRETMLEFECDWKPGIGGSIWTSGELLVAHLELHRKHYRSIFDGARVVELGSGTGYVGLMVATCFRPAHIYLTDLPTHLNGLQRNLERNCKAMRAGVQVHVSELSWGSSEQELALLESIATDSNINDTEPVSVILGTDVAYMQDLYDPLIHTINHLGTSCTLILLGLNRADTRHTFFRQLEQHNFEYYKIPDFKLPENYWGRDFGLFKIRRSSFTFK